MMQSMLLSDMTIRRLLSGVLVIALAVACFTVLRPFLASLLWAVVIVVSAHPALDMLHRRFGFSRGTVTLLLVVSLLVILVLPLTLMSLTLADHVRDVHGVIDRLLDIREEGLPAWVLRLPLVGEQLDELFRGGVRNVGLLKSKLEPVLRGAATHVLSGGSKLLELLVETLLAIVFCALIAARSTDLVQQLTRTASYLAGHRGVHLLDQAGRTIRSVMLGVVGISIMQTLMISLGFQLAHVPGVLILTLAAFVLSLAQIGVFIIWMPSVIWLFYTDQHLASVMLLIWSVMISVLEHFLKPVLISQGSGLPLLVVFAGVIGGIIAWGALGIFTGAIVLGLGYTLLCEWLADEHEAASY
ncbi:MAG: hypothetical protein RIQ52_925 [Pseudomonadota bacterium]|jgi:predicted PurR-regulated permease PerM